MGLFRLILCFGLSLSFLSIVSTKNMGPIHIKGVEETIYVIAPDWAVEFVIVQEDGFTLSGGGRVYFAKYPVDDFSDPFAYWQSPLIGYNLSYEIGNHVLNFLINLVQYSILLSKIKCPIILFPFLHPLLLSNRCESGWMSLQCGSLFYSNAGIQFGTAT